MVEGRSLLFVPNAEVQDDVGAELQGADGQPDQTALEDIALRASQRLAERPRGQVGEQRTISTAAQS